MKAAYISVLFTAFLHLSSFCQKTGETVWQKYIREAQLKPIRNRPFNTHTFSIPNKGLSVDRLSIAQLLTPDSLKKYINNKRAKTFPAKIQGKRLPEKQQANNSCNDSSFVRLLGTYASWIFVEKVVPVSDGGILIPALLYDTTQPHITWRGTAILLKVDDLGNVVWIKQFDNTDPVTFSTFVMNNAFELSNKDIICVGNIDTTNGNSDDNTILYHLDNNGNIIWQTALHTNITNAFPDLFDITIVSLAEGLNGDLILAALCNSTNSAGKYETIIRLDKSGNVIWDANYGNYGDYNLGAEGIAVYVQNGNITEVGISHGSSNPTTPAAINFLTLDYNTGNLLSKRFFRPSYSNAGEEFNKTFTYYFNQCTLMPNGHFIISGKLFSDFTQATNMIDHFGVIEFDANLNLLNSYTISSPVHTDYWDDLLYFNEQGKGLISLLESVNYPDINLYFGSFENRQFLNERKVSYNNIGLPGHNGLAYTKDNGYIFAQSYFEGGTKSSIEFRKMHNSDTSSICLGRDTLLMQFLPLHIIEDPSYYYLDSNKRNQITNVHYNLSQNDTLKVMSTNPCKQVNYCDTVKIHGNPFICGSQPAILFTAYKNPSCGGIVQWNIDSTGIDSMQVLTDTSVLIHFKNVNWKGVLYASLPLGKCNIPTMDTLQISIIKLQAAINLGIDTALCKGNTLILHAGNTFTNYQWQDGSTDSIFKVTSPGKYYVSASDQCSNHFSDTIIVSNAYFPFSIGADTVRCNNDTIHLTATVGFMNYQWQPHYYISADTGRTVTVLPAADTFYIASAQKYPGCYVSDTINIKVFSSPSIHLGNDTTLCAGQSLTLNSGNGFASYAWSNGATSQQVTVNKKGIYFVRATAANSCVSSDTLEILNITPLPVFTLGSDTVLCMDTIYAYNFNLSNATYLWNDGSTSNHYNISQPGIYWLSVTQQGCIAKDTVIIGYKNNPVANLGNDTTLCTGKSYLLNATYNNAKYLWQDGSVLPEFLVTAAGNYNVAVNLNGCIAKDTIQINYLDKPLFTLGRDTLICQGETILLQPHLNVQANFLWQDGSVQPTYEVRDTGVFSLKASNICGSFFDALFIGPGTCNLMLPNAFSPNGDGLNDIFRIKYPFTVKEFRLTIFNRFGEKIFETTDMSKGWSGTYKGNDQPEGSYVWVVQLTGLNNIKQTSKGIVTLIK